MDEAGEIRILIIEDQPTHATLMRARLMDSDPSCRVEIAPTGESGIESVRKTRFALILLDYSLPDGDGLTFFDRIRAIDSSAHIVFVTAENSAAVAVQAMKRGASDYIVKDATYLENLVDRLKRAWVI